MVERDAEQGDVRSAALFARHMLHKDFPAARAVFDEATADRDELYEFATALVSITNAVLTSKHGRAFADEYLERLMCPDTSSAGPAHRRS